jgi:hypothetical protein
MATIEYKEVQSGGSVQIKTMQVSDTGVSTLAPSVAGASQGYVTLTEEGIGPFHITKINLGNVPVTLGNTTGISFGSVGLMTFPKGKIHIISSNVEDFLWGLGNEGNVTPIAGTMGGDIALGSTATADATLNSTDVNVLASTSYDPFSTAISANSAINAILDGSSTAITLYLNAIIDDADVADTASDVLEATGTIRVVWYATQG